MKAKHVWLIILAGLILIVGYQEVTTNDSDTDSIKIGGNLELSGNAAAYGSPIADALILAVEHRNESGGILGGQEIEAVVTDNKSDLIESQSIATRFASDENTVGIIGPTATSVAEAAIPAITRGEIPTILGASTGDELTLDHEGNVYDWLFRVCFEDSYQGLAAGKFAIENLDTKKALIILDNSLDYSTGLAKAFVEEFESGGGEVVGTEAFAAGDTDFNAVLTKIKDKDFDMLYIPGYYTETGLIIRQARDMGIEQPIVGGDGYHSTTLVDLAGAENLNDVYFTTHFYSGTEDEDVRQFLTDFEERFGYQADTFAALGYDATNLMLDAIERAGSTEHAAIREAIEETKDFEGITGTFSFDAEHNPIKPALMLEMQGGQAVNATEITVENN